MSKEIRTNLQPIMRALCNFIGCVLLQGLHHEAFTGVYTTQITHTWAQALMHQNTVHAAQKGNERLIFGIEKCCCFTESDRVTHRGQENSI